MIKNIPILTFIIRYWLILLLTAGALLLTRNEYIFAKYGAFVYAPALVLLALLLNALNMHLLFRETIDKETHEGTYLREWRALPAMERIRFTVQYRCWFFMGACIIIHAVAK